MASDLARAGSGREEGGNHSVLKLDRDSLFHIENLEQRLSDAVPCDISNRTHYVVLISSAVSIYVYFHLRLRQFLVNV